MSLVAALLALSIRKWRGGTKRLRRLVGEAFCLFVISCSSSPTKTPRPDGPAEAHQLAHLLFYVEADYRDSQSTQELAQHKIIANDLAKTASQLPKDPTIAEEVARLKALVDGHAAATQVKQASAEIQGKLLRAYPLERSPAQRPDKARGESLFTLLCADCHGKDGRAQTRRASQLKTPPASLADEKIIGPLSPYRVFNFLRFGLGEMPSFELSSVEDRWSLAFYVFSLRDASQAANGEILAALPASIPKNFDSLATISDDELRALLQREGVVEIDAAVRALRRLSPYKF